ARILRKFRSVNDLLRKRRVASQADPLLSRSAASRLQETPSAFHPRAQRNVFHRRCVRQQSRSFVLSESIADTQPQLHPALLRLSAMIRRRDGEPNAVSSALGCAKFYSRSHDAVIRVYDYADEIIRPSNYSSVVEVAAPRRTPGHHFLPDQFRSRTHS